MAAGSHPFPFRTRQLSPPAPMVLGGRPPGRVGRRRDSSKKRGAHASGRPLRVRSQHAGAGECSCRKCLRADPRPVASEASRRTDDRERRPKPAAQRPRPEGEAHGGRREEAVAAPQVGRARVARRSPQADRGRRRRQGARQAHVAEQRRPQPHQERNPVPEPQVPARPAKRRPRPLPASRRCARSNPATTNLRARCGRARIASARSRRHAGAGTRRRPRPPKSSPASRAATPAGAQMQLARAAEAYEAGRERDAARLLRPLRDAYPDASAVRELLGLCQYRLGNYAAAAKELEAFVELTDSVEQHPVLMDCMRAMGKYRRVDELWEELAAASPSNALVTEGRIVLAGSRADRGRVRDAIAHPRPARGRRATRAGTPPAPLVRARRPLRTGGRDRPGARPVLAHPPPRRVVRRRRRTPRRPGVAVTPPRYGSSPPTSPDIGRSAHRAVMGRSRWNRRKLPELNVAVVRGTCSSPAEVRTLPSGERARPAAGHDPRRRAARCRCPVAVVDPPAWVEELDAGDEIVVVGQVRRRFFRAGGATASRVEIEADTVAPAARPPEARHCAPPDRRARSRRSRNA